MGKAHYLTHDEVKQVQSLLGHLNSPLSRKELAIEARLIDANGEHVGTVTTVESGDYGLVMNGE